MGTMQFDGVETGVAGISPGQSVGLRDGIEFVVAQCAADRVSGDVATRRADRRLVGSIAGLR